MNRTLRSLIVSVSALILITAFIACKKQEAPKATEEGATPTATQPVPVAKAPAPAPAPVATGGGGIDKLVGKWGADVEAIIKNTPEAPKDPKAAEMMKGMLGSMKIEFTKDSMIAEMMGQKETVKFKVASTSSDGLILEATEGAKAGKKNNVKFIDATHVSMTEESGAPGKVMFLKKL